MGNYTLVPASAIREDDSIRAGTSPRVNLVATKNRKLLVRFRIWEREAFVIIVGMRVLVRADGLAFLEIRAALRNGFVDVGLVIASASACINALALKLPQVDQS